MARFNDIWPLEKILSNSLWSHIVRRGHSKVRMIFVVICDRLCLFILNKASGSTGTSYPTSGFLFLNSLLSRNRLAWRGTFENVLLKIPTFETENWLRWKELLYLLNLILKYPNLKWYIIRKRWRGIDLPLLSMQIAVYSARQIRGRCTLQNPWVEAIFQYAFYISSPPDVNN